MDENVMALIGEIVNAFKIFDTCILSLSEQYYRESYFDALKVFNIGAKSLGFTYKRTSVSIHCTFSPELIANLFFVI